MLPHPLTKPTVLPNAASPPQSTAAADAARGRFSQLPQAGEWSVLLNLAAVFCVLFGFALILNVQVAGDGMWFWYAKFFLAGRHLYGDLHLALQPLYVLVTAANMRLFGEGWLIAVARRSARGAVAGGVFVSAAV